MPRCCSLRTSAAGTSIGTSGACLMTRCRCCSACCGLRGPLLPRVPHLRRRNACAERRRRPRRPGLEPVARAAATGGAPLSVHPRRARDSYAAELTRVLALSDTERATLIAAGLDVADAARPAVERARAWPRLRASARALIRGSPRRTNPRRSGTSQLREFDRIHPKRMMRSSEGRATVVVMPVTADGTQVLAELEGRSGQTGDRRLRPFRRQRTARGSCRWRIGSRRSTTTAPCGWSSRCRRSSTSCSASGLRRSRRDPSLDEPAAVQGDRRAGPGVLPQASRPRTRRSVATLRAGVRSLVGGDDPGGVRCAGPRVV